MAIRRLLLSRTIVAISRVAFAFLLVLLSVLLASPPTASADTEPGDNMIGGANVLTMTQDPAGSGYYIGRGNGSIDPSTDVDYWSFQAFPGDLVSIAVETPNSGLDVAVQLRNSADGNLETDNGDGPDSDAFISHYTIAGSDTYYVRVFGQSSSTGSYELRVDLARGIQLESDAEYSNDSSGGANVLVKTLSGVQEMSAKVAGTIMSPQGSTTDEDRFDLGILSGGSTLTLSMTVPSSSTLIPLVSVFDSAGTQLADTNVNDAVFSGTIPSDGKYYAEVSSAYWIYNGHRYNNTSTMTVTAGEAYANEISGRHLVTINDQAEQDWIFATFSRYSYLKSLCTGFFRSPIIPHNKLSICSCFKRS